MYSAYMALVLAILCMNAALLVNAGLYILEPSQGSTCRSGQPCTIRWIDDGVRPVLSAVGVATVGLFTGKQQLVQTIPAVNVANSISTTFTPMSAAGPNSDAYYIAIISTTLKANDSTPYSGFSPYFSLEGMSGSFNSPLPAATSPIPIPSTLSGSSGSVQTTITVGNLATPIPPISSSSTSSTSPAVTTAPTTTATRISTSTTPLPTSVSTSSTLSSAATSFPANTGGAIGGASHLSLPLSVFALVVVSTVLVFVS